MMYKCPVCGYDKLVEEPRDFAICPCCGTEFGYHNASLNYRQIRARWLANGAKWFSKSTRQPFPWDPLLQLEKAQLEQPWLVRFTSVNVSTTTLPTILNMQGVTARILAAS